MTKTIDIPMLSAFDKFWHDCLDKQPTDIYTSQIDNGTYNASKIAMLPIFKAGYESAQAPLQGEPVYFYRNKEGDVYSEWFETDNKFYEFVQDLSHGGYYQWRKVFTAPPSTEALQKDKAELIEYARILRKGHKSVVLLAAKISQAEEISNKALDIPLPKCME